jgi:hypothetical protein
MMERSGWIAVGLSLAFMVPAWTLPASATAREAEQQQARQEPEQRKEDERPRIRVLPDPAAISSFYRRDGISNPYRYRLPLVAPEEGSLTPASPYSWAPRHPISRFYRGAPFGNRVFYPPGFVPYAERALLYRVYRPGLFLGSFAFPRCPCDCPGN